MKKDRKEIISKRTDYKGLSVFWKQVEQAILDGYRFDDQETHLKDIPRATGIVRVVLFKPLEQSEPEKEVKKEVDEPVIETKEEEAEIESTEKEVEDKVEEEVEKDPLEGVNSKKDLLKFAKENEIEIPEDIKHPKAIKAYIKNKLS